MEPELELRLGIRPFCAGGLLLCTIIRHTTDWEIVFSVPYPFWPMVRNMFYLMTQYTHMCTHVFYVLNPYPRMCFYCFERAGRGRKTSISCLLYTPWLGIELATWPFGAWDYTPNESHQPGLNMYFKQKFQETLLILSGSSVFSYFLFYF